MAEPRRVLVLAHASVLDASGYARRALDSAKALAHALPRAAVALVSVESPCRAGDAAAREEVERECLLGGVRFHVVRGLPRRLGLARLADRVAAKAVGRRVKADGIEAIHAHGPRATRAALSIAGRVPVVADVHGDRAAEGRLERGEPDGPDVDPAPEEAAVVASAAGAVYASAPLAARFPTKAGRPSVVVEGLVGDERRPSDDEAEEARAAGRASLATSPHAPVLAYAGSLAAWQEVPRLAAAFRLAVRRDPRARLLVITHDPAGAEVVVAAARVPAGSATVVSARGPDVARRLCAADAGALLRRPALANTLAFPVKFAEYVAAGLAVVVTDAVPAVAEHLRRGALGEAGLGDVVPAWADDATLADRLLAAAAPTTPAARAARRAYARDALSWRVGVEAYRGLYARL